MLIFNPRLCIRAAFGRWWVQFSAQTAIKSCKYLMLQYQMCDINSIRYRGIALAQNGRNAVPCTFMNSRQRSYNQRVGCLQRLGSRAFGPAKWSGLEYKRYIIWIRRRHKMTKKNSWAEMDICMPCYFFNCFYKSRVCQYLKLEEILLLEIVHTWTTSFIEENLMQIFS